MRARLDDWLRSFAADGPLDEAGLERRAAELRLRGMGDAEARAAAPLLAGLHEQVLRSGRSVAVRSFHAWFAQLVAAAPLDTLRAIGLPADAALIEKTDDLRDELFARFHAAVRAEPALLRQTC
jgi:ATP-dependent helicase/nuclease subunit A